MTYELQGDRVTLTMTRDDYDLLTLILGYACGAARVYDEQRFYRWLEFVNKLNQGNRDFTPYEIPPEYNRPN